MKRINKVLVANRGEIAIRVMKTLKLLGVKSVAVYSEADKTSKHLSYADEAYYIGEAEASKSYLNMDKIIDVAKKSGCDAIHPGYGFLAENPVFAKKVNGSGIIWIGPSSECMRSLGDKINSREIAKAAGIPTTPGGTIESMEQAKKLAKELGYPVLIKASAGGGGKGMRIVQDEEELGKAIELARQEAQAAFADPTVYIEKYIVDAHHIEIQFLIDKEGNGLFFPERECSVQRRYQKIIEETPSPTIDRETAIKMGKAAISVSKKAGYEGAGTVEFIYDKTEGKFYFLEVNARIQVEHPVTEEVTGLDLIAYQIYIADGQTISLSQESLNNRISGHAIESRIYAEDPDSDFMPSIGKVEHYKEPFGIGIRVDSGFFKGSEVSINYDPLIAKLIVKAPNREMAINRMYEALSNYHIAPIKTTIPLLKRVFKHRKFIEGDYNTKFLDIYKEDLFSTQGSNKYVSEGLALLEFVKQHKSSYLVDGDKTSLPLCWDMLGKWRG